MINWLSLLTNTLWLLALSAALAIAGWVAWQAAREDVRFLEVLRRHRYSVALQGCLSLFCLGVALSVKSAWEQIAWAALTLITMLQLVISARSFNAKTQGRKEK